MKKYPNFTKYFNRTPRGWAIFVIVFYLISFLGSIMTIFTQGLGAGLGSLLYSLVWTIVVVGFFAYIYYTQMTLEKARIGKHLTKYYGLEGEALTKTFEEIENGLEKPRYSDAMNKRRYNSFFVTENWAVGTEGVMLLRANAVKLSDIKTIEKNILTRRKKGITTYYHILQITDKNDYVHQFYLRSQENLDMAYDFLMNL